MQLYSNQGRFFCVRMNYLFFLVKLLPLNVINNFLRNMIYKGNMNLQVSLDYILVMNPKFLLTNNFFAMSFINKGYLRLLYTREISYNKAKGNLLVAIQCALLILLWYQGQHKKGTFFIIEYFKIKL